MSQNIIPSFKDLKTKLLLKFGLDDLRLSKNNTLILPLDKIYNLEEFSSKIQHTSQSALFSKAKNLLINFNTSFDDSYKGDSNTAGSLLWQMYDDFIKLHSQNKIIVIGNSLNNKSLHVINKDTILLFNINYSNTIINSQDYMFSLENEQIINNIKVETLIYSDKYVTYKYRIEFNEENEINSFEGVSAFKNYNDHSINLSSTDISLQTYNNPVIITGVMNNVLEQIDEFFI